MRVSEFPLLSESLNKVSTTGKLLRQFLENLRRWVMGSVLDRRVRQRDTDSFVVYLLLILTFLHEFSLVTAAFPLVLYSFALVSPGAKSLRFWNLIFYYCEIVLSLRYCFWIPFVHRCPHFEAGTCEELRESPRDWWLLCWESSPSRSRTQSHSCCCTSPLRGTTAGWLRWQRCTSWRRNSCLCQRLFSQSQAEPRVLARSQLLNQDLLQERARLQDALCDPRL